MRKNESKTDIPSPPLHKAIINRDLKQLKKLLLSGDGQLHPVTKETPLHVAARSGSMECLRWLLDNNINSPFEKDRDGSTPGHFCAAYGQLEALKVIAYAMCSSWVYIVIVNNYVNNTFQTIFSITEESIEMIMILIVNV